MNYFAEIVNDIVTQVILVSAEVSDGAEFCHNLLGGEWVQTYMDNPNKQFAAIGYIYDPATQDFISPTTEPTNENIQP